MKRFHVCRGLWTAALLCLVLTVCLLVGCGGETPAPAESGSETVAVSENAEGTESLAVPETADESASDTSGSESEETSSVEETDADEETGKTEETGSDEETGKIEETGSDEESDTTAETEDSGWKPAEGIFNEGIVNYEKLVETEIVSAYPDDQIGQIMSPGKPGVATIFQTDFSDNDVTAGGKASPRSAESFSAIDGKMYFPYSASSPDHLAGDGWTTWAPNEILSLSSYRQTALTVNWDVRSKDTGAWLTAMIGCYVTNVAGKIPDGPGDGLWISFQENANRISIYHPDTASWPEAWSHIPVESGLMSGMFEATVVCTPDRATFVYITPEGGTAARLVATIRFADGKIRTYDEENTMITESNCTTNSLKGEGYSLFVHGGGAAVVEDVTLMGASSGEVVEHITVTATPTEGNSLGLDITDKTGLVSICYSVWFDAILGGGTEPVTDWNNITEVLAGEREWGGVHAFHYWAKPAVGYYRSSDKAVIRTHMNQLYTAGVDFIVIDLTNAGDGYLGTSAWTSYIQKPMDAICDTIMEMRAEGQGTPYVVFWVGDGNGPLYKELYDKYHSVERWKDCFVYWEGKPFMLTTHKQPDEFPYKDLLTVRSMWGLRGEGGYQPGQWSFLNVDNSIHVAMDGNGKPEQVSVAVASQETYMSMPSAHGREGGFFWFRQWYHAFDVRPKIVTLTWWNEWTAQRFDVDGKPHFTDNYNQNYSRDIEPMTGGHGDQYYRWLIQYISAYKGGEDCPILVEERMISRVEKWLKSQ